MIRTRKDAARRDGRWSAVRTSYVAYLRGLAIALDRRLDPDRLAAWAGAACQVAHDLAEHDGTRQFLQQRTSRGGTSSYDGLALLLLVTLAEGWGAAVRSGALPEEGLTDAVKIADVAVREIKMYLDAVQTGEAGDTSRLDPLRIAMAEQAIHRWETRRSG